MVCWDTLYRIYPYFCKLGHPVQCIPLLCYARISCKVYVYISIPLLLYAGTPCTVYTPAMLCWDTLHSAYPGCGILGPPVQCIPRLWYAGTPCKVYVYCIFTPAMLYWDTLYSIYPGYGILGHPVALNAAHSSEM